MTSVGPMDTANLRKFLDIAGGELEILPGVPIVFGRYGVPPEIVRVLCDELDELRARLETDRGLEQAS